ncbi:hypothetical protein [Dactylosporangium cerinum]
MDAVRAVAPGRCSVDTSSAVGACRSADSCAALAWISPPAPGLTVESHMNASDATAIVRPAWLRNATRPPVAVRASASPPTS